MVIQSSIGTPGLPQLPGSESHADASPAGAAAPPCGSQYCHSNAHASGFAPKSDVYFMLTCRSSGLSLWKTCRSPL